MAVIIGSATMVTVDNSSDGIQSVSWSVQASTNRLWQIGSWAPYKTQVTKTITCNLTTYAGVLSPVTLSVADSCTDSTAFKNIYVDANSCSVLPAAVEDLGPYNMYITSYSYSKGDPTAFGTESWSFQLWVHADPNNTLGNDFIPVPEPNVVIQGITEGNYSGDFSAPTKVGIDPHAGYTVAGSQGQVSAGFPGLGEASEINYCIVSRIGGGVLGDAVADQGKTGNSQANVQHTPLYTGV